VRELENIADRIAVYLVQFDEVARVDYDALRDDCPELFLAMDGAAGAEDGDMRARVTRELERCSGNRALAAHRLGISRSTLWRWMKQAQAQ
jgi:propionate catabolism operon transcriptional regulator